MFANKIASLYSIPIPLLDIEEEGIAHELGHYFIDPHRHAMEKGLMQPHIHIMENKIDLSF